MKTNSTPLIGHLALACLLALGCLFASGNVSNAQAKPKRVLVVTTTAGFYHSSIPTAEKILAELGQRSGAFTVEYARVEIKDPHKFNYAQEGKSEKAKYEPAFTAVL